MTPLRRAPVAWQRRRIVHSALVAVPLAAGTILAGSCTGGVNDRRVPDSSPPELVGREACAGCHEEQAELWAGSHHDLAMQQANGSTVLGEFDGASFEYYGVESKFFRRDGKPFVRTDGPDGEMQDYEIAYTFGVEPLQQYLIAAPGGRFQALSIAWDSRPKSEGGQRWFHLYPDEKVTHDDPLHWTGRFQNWNTMCAECHSTGFEKGYDVENDSYKTTSNEIDVSCEACHGAGSRHVGWAEARAREHDKKDSAGAPGTWASMELVVDLAGSTSGIWIPDAATGNAKRENGTPSRVEIDTCGRCHARRSMLAEGPPQGAPLADTHRLALLEDALYFADGQIRDEVYVHGSFLQSRMHAQGVTCGDCHEPHGLTLRADGNALCARCHAPERFDTKEHHFHRDGSRGSECVECHMPERTYMIVDPRRDHSFRVPRPGLSENIGAPDTCTGCHSDKTAAWAEGVIAGQFSSATPQPDAPHYGATLDAGRRGAPGAREALHALATDAAAPAIVRATALSVLEPIAGRETVSVIGLAARDASPIVRAEAARILTTLPAPARLAAGLELLDDPVLGVRIEAAAALASWPADRLEKTQAERLSRVIDEYRAAQRHSAERPESQINLGNIERQLRRFDKSEAAYRKALRSDATFAPAYVNLADLARLRGRDADGEAILREGIVALDEPDGSLDPAGRNAGRAVLRHSLGLLLVRQKLRDDGIDQLRLAHELSGGQANFAHAYGVALYSTERRDEAFDVLEKTLRDNPFDRSLLQALTTMHRDAGHREAALEHALTLQTLDPDEPGVGTLVRQLRASLKRRPTDS